MISILLHILLVKGQYFTNYSQTNQYILQTQYYNSNSSNITLTPQNLQGWFAQIEIGSPFQYFQIQIDTGSDILWVGYQNCRNCNIKNLYYSQDQTYFQTNGTVYTQNYYYRGLNGNNYYDQAECSGIIATDLVQIFGTPIYDIFLMMFATYESGFGSSEYGSGIMGLSNNQSFQNIFQVSYTNGQINSELFGFIINPLPLSSLLIFGDIDPQILDDAIWVTAEGNQSWRFYINLLQINGEDYSKYVQSDTYGYLASGVSCLIVNFELYEAIFNNFLEPAGCIYQDDQDEIYCPCWNENNATYPNITLVLNQVTINVPYQNLFLDFYESPPDDICQVCLEQTFDNLIILGGPVFQSVIPIFNKAANQVGFVGGVKNNIPNSDNS